jgi:DNA-directed RNA polymerase subunit F
MTKPEILSEKPINTIELKSEIEKIKKRDKELNFRAERTDEYLHHVVNISSQKGEELFSKIEKLNVPRMKDIHIHKILDTMPTTVDALKAVLQAYVITVSQDNLKKIISLIEESTETKK